MPEEFQDRCLDHCVHPDTVNDTRARMPADPQLSALAEQFKILGDFTRVRILAALAANEHCVCDLTALLDLSQSAVSHQLRILRTARLVRCRREGRMAFYSLDDEHIETLLAEGLKHVQHG